MEPGGSLPHSHEHVICPCREPDASSAGPSIPYLKGHSIMTASSPSTPRSTVVLEQVLLKDERTDGRCLSLNVLARAEADSLPDRKVVTVK